jgi:methyl-accepting chemotaxis protein
MFKSIKIKLSLYFALLIIFILLGTSYLLYQNAYNNYLSHIDGSLYVIINDLNKDIEDDGLEKIVDDLEELEDEVQMGRVHVRIISYDLNRDIQITTLKSSTTDEIFFAYFDLKSYSGDKIFYKNLRGYRTAIKSIKSDRDNVEFIEVAVELSCENNTMGTLIIVNIIIFLFSTIGAYFFISRTLQSVDSVVHSVNQIKSYDYTKRISTQNIPNEIKELIHTFNRLLTRHKSSFDKISQFSSDVSHELKTPLTTLRGEIEVGLRRERDDKEYTRILQKSLSKIIEIQQFIDGLLFLAKTDTIEIQSSFKELY